MKPVNDPKLIKQSVALAVGQRNAPSSVLLVRRPDDDEEFPGMWGLPAASCRPGEAIQEAAQRIGVQKLGGGVKLGPRLGLGRQDRAGYTLAMSLYAATLDRACPNLAPAQGRGREVTLYAAWRWGDPRELADSARQGSLCSRLLIDSLRSP